MSKKENPCKIKEGVSSSENALARLSNEEVERRRLWAFEKYCKGRKPNGKKYKKGFADIINVAEFNNEDVREYSIPVNSVSNY